MEKKDIAEMIVKAGISAVPMVGGSIVSIIGDLQSERKEKRMDEFLKTFAEEMQGRVKKIESSYISQEDFLDIFENILRDIMNQRVKFKRDCLRHLLVNSITTPLTTYDMTEEYQMLLSRLTDLHIVILHCFYQKRNIYKNNEEKDLNEIFDCVKESLAIFQLTDQKILELIIDLENLNLINCYTHNFACMQSGAPLYEEAPYISDKGLKFIEYIYLQDV